MLEIIVSTLFVAIVLNVFLKKIGLPTIIGYILTGTVIAYAFGLHQAVNNDELKIVAEFGIVFLMFTIGLEFSIKQLKKMKYEVFVAGTMQILLTTIIVYILSFYLLNIDQKVSLIIALAIALSSTAIVLKTFNETGEINRRYGQRSLGILIMQDIAVIPILLMISIMANNDSNLSIIIIKVLAGAAVLLATMWFIGKYLLSPIFEEISKTKSDELFVGLILFLAIGASYFAHELGFSYSLGAFIAGTLIAETRYKYQAEADLIPFRDLLLGVFFITVGMQIDLSIVLSYLHIIALLLVSIMVLKFIIIYMIVKGRETSRTSFKTALSLVQVGEFSLALLELARGSNLIEPIYSQVMIVTIVISMIITPIILKNLSRLTDWYSKAEEDIEEHVVESRGFEEHTVILGFGEFGQSVAKILKEKGELYLAIENKISTVQKMSKIGEPVMFGNAIKKDILIKADIKKARKVIVAIDNTEKLIRICEMLKNHVEVDKIIVKVHSVVEKESIVKLGLKHIVVENNITSQYIAELMA